MDRVCKTKYDPQMCSLWFWSNGVGAYLRDCCPFEVVTSREALPGTWLCMCSVEVLHPLKVDLASGISMETSGTEAADMGWGFPLGSAARQRGQQGNWEGGERFSTLEGFRAVLNPCVEHSVIMGQEEKLGALRQQASLGPQKLERWPQMAEGDTLPEITVPRHPI